MVKGKKPACPDVAVEIENRAWLDEMPGLETIAKKTVAAAWDFAFANGGNIPQEGVAEISLFFVDDAKIKTVNNEYRGVDRPTNVLSFPAIEDDIKIVGDMPYLAGDIIVALETTAREAALENISLEHHLTHLLIHGILHLAGFDHIRDDEAEIMEALEVKLLAEMGIKNPYAEQI